MVKKLKSSLALKTFLGIFSVLIVVSLLIYGSLRFIMPKAFESEQSERFTQNLTQLAEKLESSMENIETLVTDFAINNQTRISVSDSDDNKMIFVNYASGDALENAGNTSAIVTFQSGGETYSIVAQIAGQPVEQLTSTFARVLPIVLLIILFLSILAALLYSRAITKPIISISNVSKKMTSLDMTWRCENNRSDEIGILASNLGTMAEKLSLTLSELQSANEKLQGEIERERKQEQERIDFFRAVSHEMKTPITILKGELEGMICSVGDYTDKDKYLRHSMKTVIDMENMVQEIIAASRMASNDLPLEVFEIDMDKLIRKTCFAFRGIAEDKGIEIATVLEPYSYHGNLSMLEKAVSNIIGNAISHSPRGARITVTLENAKLMVKNTGVNIDDTMLPQLFQPFYRIDASHNSNTGGSGLGLYIVKTALERHGVSYKIENVVEGVLFSVVF